MTSLLATPADWPKILLADVADPTAAAADATDVVAATARGAFEGLRIAIEELGPDGTISAIERSGLRGRGGAGFPTGTKWRLCATTEASRRFVVANGYSADPAVFIDQALMEGNPFALLEGLAIAAYAVGATEAVIAVRAEYPEAVRRLESAVLAAEDAGFLGFDILGAGFDLTVTIRTVQGAYMLGEETVLLKALEGKRGQPEQRPPHPAERGLFGQPTVVQNIATLAAVPWILVNGPEAFKAIGASDAPGTILVQVSGAAKSGIAEVPTGTSLNEILKLAGGMTRGHTLKAVLVGGPSGGLLPPAALETPYDFGPLREAGAHVGSGSVVVADERACVVDLARLLTAFCADEACGKSIPCRIGTRRIVEIGDRFTSGRPRPTDINLLADLSHDIVESALCDHERLTTLPFASAMRYFRSELDDHILRSSCPAGVCHPIAVAGAAVGH
jgi:NADH:ubiquinone oxidoreductase subunit F (NADH-binding)